MKTIILDEPGQMRFIIQTFMHFEVGSPFSAIRASSATSWV